MELYMEEGEEKERQREKVDQVQMVLAYYRFGVFNCAFNLVVFSRKYSQMIKSSFIFADGN